MVKRSVPNLDAQGSNSLARAASLLDRRCVEDLVEKVRARLEGEKLTPMMRQYLEVKIEHPEALVMFRMGDFFELFYEDAEEAARLLDLTLTARSKEKDIPMAGVPIHAVEGYLARLVELGRRVVLVDQVEDPKTAKGLVRRAVTRVVSPATFIGSGPDRVEEKVLVAVCFARRPPRARKDRMSFGLAALDFSTGQFRATSGDTVDRLLDELARIAPREIIVLEEQRSHDGVQALAAASEVALHYVEPREGAGGGQTTWWSRALSGCFDASEIESLTAMGAPERLAAAGLAIEYVTKTQLSDEAPDLVAAPTLRHIARLELYEIGEGLVLDAQCRAHLELFEEQGGGGGGLLGAIDRCCTPMGTRRLRRWLAYPSRTLSVIRGRQDAVEVAARFDRVLRGLRQALAGVGDLERLLARVTLGRVGPAHLRALGELLSNVPELQAGFREFADAHPKQDALWRALADVDPCQDVSERLLGALSDEPPAQLGAGEVFADGFDAKLDELAALARDGKRLMAEMESAERVRTGISSLRVRYNRVFGYFIEVTKANLHLVPGDYVRKQTTVNSERFFTSELKELEERVEGAEADYSERTAELFGVLVDDVRAATDRLLVLANALADGDVLSGWADLVLSGGWVRPVVDDSEALEIEAGRHPVVEAYTQRQGDTFVPNSLSVGTEPRMLIITGPNMAGKSTLMRQAAIIAILAHMGCFVPAGRARVGVMDRIFTRVGAGDEIARGRSTFMVEMAETARILRSATAKSLVLLDEIGRGTSTYDGVAIAWAVAEHLHDDIQAKTLFATHYHELTELCAERSGAENFQVEVREVDGEILFMRRLVPGAASRSYGVHVARLAGVPPRVVRRAGALLESLRARHPVGDAAPQLSFFQRGSVSASSTPGEDAEVGAPETPAGPAAAPRTEAMMSAVDALDLDGMSPRDAWRWLAEWKAKLSEDIEAAEPSISTPHQGRA